MDVALVRFRTPVILARKSMLIKSAISTAFSTGNWSQSLLSGIVGDGSNGTAFFKTLTDGRYGWCYARLGRWQ